VSTPFLVAQLSDPHIGAEWHGEDPLEGLRAVVETVAALPNRPDAVLVSGDLSEHGSPAEYAAVSETVAAIGAPVHVIAGNHDDRASLRAAFGLPGEDGGPVQWAADLGPLRLVGLDTTIPGKAAGALGACDGSTRSWLALPTSPRSWPCTTRRSRQAWRRGMPSGSRPRTAPPWPASSTTTPRSGAS
jgi:3',5'-cyclic AMP phosphodiesterase CpdA